MLCLGGVTILLGIGAGLAVVFFTAFADRDAVAIAVAWRLVLLVGLLVTMVGVARRRQWGRWLGVLALGALATICFLIPDTTQSATGAQQGGGVIARLVIAPLIGFWVYTSAFSRKAKRYFCR